MLVGLRRHTIIPLLCAATALAGALGLSSAGAGADGSTTSSTPAESLATAGIGAASANARAVRVEPPERSSTTTTAPAPGSTQRSSSCPATGHAAVIDRTSQRAWLCTDGAADAAFPITTAISQPAPATYHVYGRDKVTTSTFGGHFSYLDNFVAFTYGTNTGARIAFHAVPRDSAGAPYQQLDTVGTPTYFGQSSGCIRVLPAQSQVIWDFLRHGDSVVVIS